MYRTYCENEPALAGETRRGLFYLMSEISENPVKLYE